MKTISILLGSMLILAGCHSLSVRSHTENPTPTGDSGSCNIQSHKKHKHSNRHSLNLPPVGPPPLATPPAPESKGLSGFQRVGLIALLVLFMLVLLIGRKEEQPKKKRNRKKRRQVK